MLNLVCFNLFSLETSLGSQVCDDALVDCAHYGSDVCTGFPDWARVNCAQFCGFCCEFNLFCIIAGFFFTFISYNLLLLLYLLNGITLLF